MKWKPLYDKIIVELKSKQEVTTESGFKFTQDMSTNKYTVLEGTVIAVGEGRLLQSGNILPMKVNVGDTVKFSKMQGESFVDDGKEYTIISETNILAYKEGE